MPAGAATMFRESQGIDCDTFPKFLLFQSQRAPSAVAIREKEYGIWQSYSWLDVARQVERLALGLSASGLCRNDALVILGRNRPHLYWGAYAAQALGAIPVSLFSDATADELVGIINHSEARIALVEDQEQVDKLLPNLFQMLKLQTIFYLDPRGLRSYDDTRLHDLNSLFVLGEQLAKDRPGAFVEHVGRGKGSDISTVCYTSGTTGTPKGVMLSFDNLISTATAMAKLESLTPSDQILAYLPMAWIGDHFFSFAQSCIVGFPVNCPESEATILSDLREIAPTYFFAPPRVFEGILTDIAIRMQNAGRAKRAVYDAFMAVAKRCGVKLLEGKPVSPIDRVLYGIGRLVMYQPLLNALGLNRLRVAYTAGEALGPEIFDFFRALGINLKQLYGQTESSVYVCVHRDGDVRSDTVGPPAPGVEVRFSEEGELLYRSPGVFVSYLKSPQDAAAIKDADGWVRSGDAAVLTDSGQIRIIDRVKDVGRSAAGALFPPKYIENKLKFFFSIKEVVAFGDGRPFVTAFINIDLEAVGNWAERRKIAYSGYTDLAAHPQVYTLIAQQIAEMNARLATDAELSHCVVRRFLILPKELDADDGELTRTRKVRRRVIAERYGVLIDALYADAESILFESKAALEDGRIIAVAANVRIANVGAGVTDDARGGPR